MADYEVRLLTSALRELESLPGHIVEILWQRIKALADQPRPVQTKKLRGAEKAYRLRVRSYRIVYTIDDEQKVVTVTAIRHRKDIYR